MAQTKGFSYDELVKPLESVQKAHNEVITDMASLSQNSEILDYYLDPSRDKESYNLYNKFKNELDFNVDDFARNGLTRNNGMKLLNLHRNYNNNVANILDAVKNREADRAEQQKLQETSKGQTIFGMNGTDGDANIRSVDFYLQGNKGFAHQNLDDVRDEAMKFAAAASKRKYYNSLDAKEQAERDMKAFANMYYREKERIGYDDKDSYNIIKKLMSQYENALGMNIEEIPDEHPDGFLKNMKRMLQERGIDQFNERDRGRMIDAYINGIDEGLTYTAKDEFKDTPEMRKASAAKTNVSVYTGEKVQHDPTMINEDQLPIGSSYKDPSNEATRNDIINNITDNELVRQNSLARTGKGTFNTLMSIDDYWDSLKDNNGNVIIKEDIIEPVYGSPIGTKDVIYKKGSKEFKEYYEKKKNDFINNLGKKFALNADEIEAIKSGTADITDILVKANERIKTFTTPMVADTYELIIPGDQNGSVLEMARIRARSGKANGVHKGLEKNPETGEWSFRTDVKQEEIDQFYNIDAAKQKGMIYSIVFAPIGSDLFQVAMSSTVWDEPLYVPLSALSSLSGMNSAHELYVSYNRQKKAMDALKNQLEATSDEDVVNQIKEHIKKGNIQEDALLKAIIKTASEHSWVKSKDQIKDPVWMDLRNLKPIKFKDTRYTEPKTNNTNNNNTDDNAK